MENQVKSVILLVDDQDTIRFFLEKTLVQEGYEALTAKTGHEAVEIARQHIPDLVLLDLKLPDMDGLEVLRKIKAVLPEICVVMITAFGDIETAVEAMKGGAYDFVSKPINLEQLLFVIDKGLESKRLGREVLQLKRQMDLGTGFEYITGESKAMKKVYDIAQQVAKTDTTTVLIEGESGVGKEMVARLIHQYSNRAKEAFLDINCASLPEQLLESELFGHEKGAFTDAKTQKLGLLEMANRGTLFLDEIGEMSLTIQVKLLKVLERMVFRRVGGTADIHVSVRVISATNRDLSQEVAENRFRSDLYYRLKVVPLTIPPLRERKEDLISFAKYFLNQFNKKFNKTMEEIRSDALEMMLDYPWPGNIRELRNVLERIVLLEDGPVLKPEYLPFTKTGYEESSIGKRIDRILSQPIPEKGVDFDKVVSDLERALILKASEQTDWNQSQTAKLLKIKRDKLRYRMKSFSLDESKEVSKS
ncbi:MAG: response regulator [Candidatus Latescibacteria bacterium]|nr:response regulator [Candidatus Latescibacterota bacterium]NIM21477.1 response regulator [Candidatus Latescibacterota bacterium]NIM65648.1 response regulator [Candidatus Latescibacterota bacterium]NIO02030.1 response regulator [Candidatus Latescibacterota bacterium]NIO28842.1 response regulator [Candidatus Latescibacterota bacterium]